jgi:hypothetical protein
MLYKIHLHKQTHEAVTKYRIVIMGVKLWAGQKNRLLSTTTTLVLGPTHLGYSVCNVVLS